MAVVSRVTKIRIADPTDTSFRQVVATAAMQDTPAGQSVVVTVVHTESSPAPPGGSTGLFLRFYTDAGVNLRTVNLSNVVGTQLVTFYFTSNGLVTGTPRWGMVEMKLQITRTDPVAYDVESDGNPNTPPSAHTATLDRGWIQGTTTVSKAISNIGLGVAAVPPAQYPESLFVRLTLGAESYVARALGVPLSAGGVSGSTASSTAAQRDVTFASVVDDRFPAAVTPVAVGTVTVPNATLTGLPDGALTAAGTGPDSVAGLQLWLKADSLALADGAEILSWADSSGVGNTATAPVAANRPTLQTVEIDGLPVARFAIDDYLTCPLSAAQAAFTMFAVVKPGASPPAHQAILGSSGTGGVEFRRNTSGKLQLLKQGVVQIAESTSTVPDDVAVIVMVSYVQSSGAWVVEIDGSADASGTSVQTLSANTTLVGLGFGSDQLRSDLAEVVVYNSALGAAGRLTVARHLGAKYAITVP